jgi:rare lipoprotein A (peptidoglycan hydrolase)
MRSKITLLVLAAITLTVMMSVAPTAQAKCQSHSCWHRVSQYRHRTFCKRHHARCAARDRRHAYGWNYATASWYGPGFYGNRTACGTTLTTGSMIVANKTMACGTRLHVCYARCVTAIVGDRGPYVAGREFDLAGATARAVGLSGVGTIRYKIG